eukprot:1145536-Pelagomonas_calceolata.AAC.11
MELFGTLSDIFLPAAGVKQYRPAQPYTEPSTISSKPWLQHAHLLDREDRGKEATFPRIFASSAMPPPPLSNGAEAAAGQCSANRAASFRFMDVALLARLHQLRIQNSAARNLLDSWRA